MIAGDCIGGCQCGAVRHTVLPHQFEDFGSAFSSMLDGVRAGQNRAAHPLGRIRMSSYEPTSAVCRFDCGAHLRLAESWTARLAGPPVIVGIQLDEVRAGTDLMSDG